MFAALGVSSFSSLVTCLLLAVWFLCVFLCFFQDVKMADLAAVGIKAYSNGFLVRTGII